MWHRLVELGLLKDLLATGIAVGGAHLFAFIPGPLKKHLAAQQRIAKSLDTTDPKVQK